MDIIAKWSEKKGIRLVRAFLESPFFIFLCGGIAAFCYICEQYTLVTLAVFVFFGIVTLFLCRDTRPILPLVLLGAISLRYKYDFAVYTSKTAKNIYIFGGIPLGIGLLYRLLVRERASLSKGGFLGVSAFSAAILLGGLFSEYYTFENFLNALLLSAALGISYIFFGLTVPKREDNLLYLARVCAVAILVLSAQIGELYFKFHEKGMPLDGVWKSKLKFGWTINNIVAEMIVFLLPALFYLIYKHKFGYLYYPVVVIGLVAMFLILCRNAIVWGAVGTVVGITVNCLIGKNKKVNRIFALIITLSVCVCGILLFKMNKVEKILGFLMEKGMTDTGRFKIWEQCKGLFYQAPLLGTGFETYPYVGGVVRKAHNIAVQMLSSAGLIGYGLYLGHRTQTVYALLKKPTVDRCFMGGCIFVGVMLGMLSSIFFHAYFLMYYSVILCFLSKE